MVVHHQPYTATGQRQEGAVVDLSPSALVMDMRLRDSHGEGLMDVVLGLRDSGKTYREIAEHLEAETGFRISHESVRQWERAWREEVAA